MTVNVSKPAINLREELADLRNQGGYQEQQFYFDGLVTNGTFDTDVSGWTAGGSTLSVVSERLRVTNDGTGTGSAYQLISLEAGRSYKISVDAYSGTAPNTQASIHANTFSGDLSSGILAGGLPASDFYYTPSSTATYALAVGNRGDNSAGLYNDFDNISVFEVDANDDVVHRMPKGWVPKDVFEDGLLQREGAAHDYEVVYDGFDYYVKPTVAPSATTQTCVIGVKA